MKAITTCIGLISLLLLHRSLVSTRGFNRANATMLNTTTTLNTTTRINTMATLYNIKDECSKEYYFDTFVKKNRGPNDEYIQTLNDSCQNLSPCMSGAQVYYHTMNNESIVAVGIQKQDTVMKGYDNCWSLYLEVTKAGLETVYSTFYQIQTTPKKNALEFKNWKIPFDKKYYGDTWLLRVFAFPRGGLMHQERYVMPKNKCEHYARVQSVIYYQNVLQERIETNSKEPHCMMYSEGSIKLAAEEICSHLQNINDKELIKDHIKHNLKLKQCQLQYLPPTNNNNNNKNVEVTDGYISRDLAIGLSIGVVMLLGITSFVLLVFHKRKSKVASNKSGVGTSNTKLLEHFVSIDRSKDSVLILHRPGCEMLDVLVRDISFIINAHGIKVKCPLLEMSQLDAEGGIASYIQRNIDTCHFILIMVTENDADSPHLKHRPYEFCIRLLSGMSFRENNCSRCIPLYLREYKDIVQCIPTFLSAATHCGYMVPGQLKELINFLTQSMELAVETIELRHKITFFIEKMKSHTKTLLHSEHQNCCRGECAFGTIQDDVSVLWPTESVCTSTRILGKYKENCTEKFILLDNKSIMSESEFQCGLMMIDQILKEDEFYLKVNNWKDDKSQQLCEMVT